MARKRKESVAAQDQPGRIPRFKSREEEAAFWDEHSPEEFAHLLKEVELKPGRPIRNVLQVELDPETLRALDALAAKEGTTAIGLLRRWIEARLGAEGIK